MIKLSEESVSYIPTLRPGFRVMVIWRLLNFLSARSHRDELAGSGTPGPLRLQERTLGNWRFHGPKSVDRGAERIPRSGSTDSKTLTDRVAIELSKNR